MNALEFALAAGQRELERCRSRVRQVEESVRSVRRLREENCALLAALESCGGADAETKALLRDEMDATSLAMFDETLCHRMLSFGGEKESALVPHIHGLSVLTGEELQKSIDVLTRAVADYDGTEYYDPSRKSLLYSYALLADRLSPDPSITELDRVSIRLLAMVVAAA
ncbi:MAG: hypothetical protein LBF24_03250 [Puniceicoccales bacterium]|jgi:hypothetical protein|nr:hypothetical protein [Puniceicoccales bacterium]